jgi:phosphoadenosine phosphosulfate reductase
MFFINFKEVQKHIQVYFPEDDVQNLLNSKGPNSFYESVENRKSVVLFEK